MPGFASPRPCSNLALKWSWFGVVKSTWRGEARGETIGAQGVFAEHRCENSVKTNNIVSITRNIIHID
jgi:hypothetical protein